MSIRTSTRPAAVLGAGILAVALGFASSSVVGAEAGAPAGVTKAQVKKIAAAQAVKQINALAPTLSVKSAQTAGSAMTAQSATTAQSAVTAASAATAAKIGTADVKTFGVDLATDGAAVALGTVSGLTLTATCPAGLPTIVASAAGGKLRYQGIDNTDAPFSDGANPVTSTTVTTASRGSGFLSYKSPSNQSMNTWYGWRLDGTTCSFFGTMLGS